MCIKVEMPSFNAFESAKIKESASVSSWEPSKKLAFDKTQLQT